jgi:hypothetical protein
LFGFLFLFYHQHLLAARWPLVSGKKRGQNRPLAPRIWPRRSGPLGPLEPGARPQRSTGWSGAAAVCAPLLCICVQHIANPPPPHASSHAHAAAAGGLMAHLPATRFYPIPCGIPARAWGARWTPSRSQVQRTTRCHQKNTGNSAGSPVGSLAPPPGHPTAGRCGRVVPVPPLLLCSFVPALLREPGLRLGLGVKAPLPLHASSRGVLPRAGALAGYRTQ